MSHLELPLVPPFRDGLYLGLNAVSDLALVVDCPQGCYFQLERVALNHDLNSALLDPLGRHRVVFTEVDYARLPMGTEAALERCIEAVAARLSPPLMLVTEATMVELTGNDLDALATRLEGRLGLPVRRIRSQSLDGDYLDGFAAFLEAVARALAPARVESPEAVGLIGYFPDRLEQDHLASLAELGRLVQWLGVPYAGALCDGGDASAVRRVLGAGLLVGLPHARGLASRIAALTGAQALELPLPIGLAGTAQWLTSLAERLGRASRAQALVDSELSELVPALDRVRSLYLQGLVAVPVHDPHWTPGLVDLLRELGLHVPLAVTRGGLTPEPPRGDAETVFLGATSARALATALDGLGLSPGVDLLLGATSERVLAAQRGASFVELGYPSLVQHALSPRPLLGFAGVRRLADELLSAVLAREWARTARLSASPAPDACRAEAKSP
jgi:nitrogenase molybdenum-iron protein alpha/beta subunit